MKKEEFLSQLKKEIETLSAKDVDDVINYYNELIQDRIENGENEEDVIVSLGAIDIIANNILEEKKNTPKVETVKPEIVNEKENTKTNEKKNWSASKIILVILASPLLLVLLIIILSLLIALLGIIFGLFVASISLIFAGCVGFIGSFVHMAINFPSGLIQLGLSLIIISLCVLLINCVCPFVFKLIKTGFLKIKNSFKKENK